MSAMRRDVGAAALGEARLWLGTPYRHQASLRGVGCDCLGLLRGVWRGLYGVEPEGVPPYSATWAESVAPGTDPLGAAAARHLVPVAGSPAAGAQRAGDVLLFAFRRHLPARHCAIATGDGAMIHAHDGAVVAEVALTAWWRRHLTGVFRFPGSGSGRSDPVATVGSTPKTSMTLRPVASRSFDTRQ
ncbi:NlpC/P60 family protein [Methylobacterium sp. PvR107]|uniref:NlpC/P60 family protein n=1 Tax=Methylobacterium sp. PvR107 TaxID=2806597 RepID=UPI001AE5FF2B|nr:NlpC/P60 family protein [Methylobacterium sp. PvR107]MBP1180451.1 NlpC/P60 family putative phage cell wall peptidase [Methylobacterium sp. PvR107]